MEAISEPTQPIADLTLDQPATVVRALAALAHEHRLAVFRLLVEAGPEGRIAGDLATVLALPASSLSFHLSALTEAGLVSGQREGRTIRYRAAFAEMNALLGYLTANCCAGAGCELTMPACVAPAPANPPPFDVVIYHNPDCGTSRNALGLIRAAGIEPHVIEYLKTPPSRAALEALVARAGITPRALLREKSTPYAELGLDDPALDDASLYDAMMAYPILINRPLVVTPLGVTLCRPSETVRDVLPPADRA